MAVILIFLPLADSLSSLALVSITTGLIVLTLMIDVYGSTSMHDEFWKCTSQRSYRAHCPIKRKLAVDAVKTGTTIKLEEVQVLDGGEKAYHDVCPIGSQISPGPRSPVCSKYDSSPKSSIDREVVLPDIDDTIERQISVHHILLPLSTILEGCCQRFHFVI